MICAAKIVFFDYSTKNSVITRLVKMDCFHENKVKSGKGCIFAKNR